MSKITIYDATGSQTKETLAFDFTARENTGHAYAVSVRRLLQSWRQGTVACKTRGEVSMSNKKPWKQKGTGRARAGTSRSPLWRKGGVIFGPQKRVAHAGIPRKQRRLALNGALDTMLQAGLHCVDYELAEGRPSTKAIKKILDGLKLNDKKVIFVLDFNDTNMYMSVRNLPNVQILFYDQPNVFDMTNGKAVLFFKKDADQFKHMISKWS